MAQVIDGKKIAEDIRGELKAEAFHLREKTGVRPGLAVILAGDDPASQIYVRRKENACDEAGFLSRVYRLPAEAEEGQIASFVRLLNADADIHGILVQLPLPRHLNPDSVIEAIEPRKDVDGLHPYNVGHLFTGHPLHHACTPSGIIELLDRSGIPIEGREAVVIGRSILVGKPLALMLLARHATVTICHTRTKNLSEVTKRAEILVAAAGNPEMIKADMVRDGAVVIDVGTNRSSDGRLVGDVAYAEVLPKTSWITPVPGGVGPMTIAMLLRNTLHAAQRFAGTVK